MQLTDNRLPWPAERVRRWQRSYARRLIVTDAAIILTVAYGSQLLRFGITPAELPITGLTADQLNISYTIVSAIVVAGWLAVLSYFATRDYKFLGTGSTEYRRITNATVGYFGVLAIVGFLIQSPIGRGYILIALPTGLLLLLLGRWGWRQWLHRQRAKGEYGYRAVVMGEREKSVHVSREMAREPNVGIALVGAVTAHGTTSQDLESGVPVLGNYGSVLDVIDETGADMVILTGADTITPVQMRRLGWDLEGRSVSLIVAPALTDVAGPRIHARPVAGLPLIQVDYPVFEGRKYVAKRAFDVLGSILLIVLASPVLLAVAIAVKVSSPGSVFYTQERVGLRGEPFRMFKFRSMVQGAHDQLQTLLDAQGTSDKPLFKINDDPRITRVGKFIRRYSIDELPQLFNVLIGTMSLVGPRPQHDAEVALYDDAAHRRHFMKPGITGLWQVSGRSDLDWDDAVRLDLYYVENWSMTGDIVILYRTVRAVAKADGAY